jgi:hypothetical protein
MRLMDRAFRRRQSIPCLHDVTPMRNWIAGRTRSPPLGAGSRSADDDEYLANIRNVNLPKERIAPMGVHEAISSGLVLPPIRFQERSSH